MPRVTPDVDLAFCETHDLLKIIRIEESEPPLNFGTAELFYNAELYKAEIVQTGDVKSSLTSTSDRVTIGVQNIDKQIGLTINTAAASLIGAKATFMKAFKVGSTLIHQLPMTENAVSHSITGALTRSSGDNAWNAGGWMTQGIRRVGYIEAKLTNNTDGASWIGLSEITESDFNVAAPSRDWTFYASLDRYLYVYFRGTLVRHTGVQWNGGDIIKINLLESGEIQFMKNGEVLHNEYWTVPTRMVYGMAGIWSNISGIQQLNYLHDNEYDAKVLLTGEITDIKIDQAIAELTVTSDIATGQAYAANYEVGEFCPLVFKSVECGYEGEETFCSKKYATSDGCAGRNNQHRFGGIYDKGELSEIIPPVEMIEEIIGPNSGNYNYGYGYHTYFYPQTYMYY